MCKDQGGEVLQKRFPKMPRKVGGETDIIIGIKYFKYFPEEVHKFPSGLSGSDGVYGGPHPQFTKAEKKHRDVHGKMCSYILPETEVYRSRFALECIIPSKGPKNILFDCDTDVAAPCKFNSISSKAYVSKKSPRCVKVFDQVETAGTEISYRCVDCRDCPECKKCPRLDSVSIQEEVEQSLIDRSVNVDIDRGGHDCGVTIRYQP